LAILIAAILLGGGYWAYSTFASGQGDVIAASGTIEATSVELTAKTPGTIASLTAAEGDTVKQGQLVAAVSRTDLVAQRERDAMGVVQAQAQLDDLNRGATSPERDEVQAGLAAAKAANDKAARDLARAEEMFKTGGISASELDRARTTAEQTKAQMEAAQARAGQVASGARTDQVAAAQAALERAHAVLKASDAVLEDLKIYAPIGGVVVSRNYEPGEYVTMGASIATVTDLSDMWIKVYIPTDDLPSIKLGQQASFTVSGLAQTFKGTVDQIATKGEFTPKAIQTEKERTNVVYAVKIRVGDGGGALKPGMPADVTFERR
jgi:HlyD family secretion protein